MNCFYTSPLLTSELSKVGITGMVQSNRRGMPKVTAKRKREPRGNI